MKIDLTTTFMKILGKNYSKDEIIIRNADSGKGEFNEFTIFWCNLIDEFQQSNEIIEILFYLRSSTTIKQWWELKDAVFTL